MNTDGSGAWGQDRRIRVFLLDDSDVVLRGIRGLINSQSDMAVVGEAGTARQAVARIPALKPDVAVLDVKLPDGNGVDVCREVRAEIPEVACLMFTSHIDDDELLQAILAGAAGYVLKQIRENSLLEAIRTVAAGGSLLDAEAAASVMERLRSSSAQMPVSTFAHLTDRDRQLAELIASGHSNREIGEIMFLSEKTVKNYVSSLLATLGVHRRTQVAALVAQDTAGS